MKPNHKQKKTTIDILDTKNKHKKKNPYSNKNILHKITITIIHPKYKKTLTTI